ncbi:sensor domain-containing diguanylate cyclase [Novosphingobium sp. YJ-S2-02]|uniref:diguanylate cyclase n=1 Tax=Novosphingobium aureum TaxID=2792964 RepID=A0A931HCC9_9SPHN|nr:sensor domain-containing diguanylate cyclase [Novosphingobium aureum]MBH0113457.1 sensor domain-containing diguanylate cyclase [Novosphingobium aureum]
MSFPTIVDDEPARLAALHRLAVLDSDPEPAFENVIALVQSVLRVPMAAVSLLDEHRQWFKARGGIRAHETPRDISFCTHAIRQDEAFIIPDARLDPRFAENPLVTGEPGIRSYLGIPLRSPDGYNLGALCVIDTEPRTFSEAEISLLGNFAQIVINEMELRRAAQYDELTRAHSRRAFTDRLEQEIERHRRYGTPASLVLIDVDHFKAVNDTHGHPVGDLVLSGIVALLNEVRRPSDVVGRLGGEEFAMLLPETDSAEAMLAADRYREAIAANPIAIGPERTLSVTASFGISGIADGIDTPRDWLACADVPLYQAKREGRNCCRATL